MQEITGYTRRYILLKEIGSGSMGQVYLAHDRRYDTQVALKRVISKQASSTDGRQTLSIANSQTLRALLAQEFKTLASLRHPNIVSVLDYGFDADKQPFFVMEYVPQYQTLLEAGQDLTFSAQVGLLGQVLIALDYLHRRGILHCDLKPSNILVTQGQVKLVDFGLASLISATQANDQLIGTLPYIPPNALLGESISARNDLYAFGILCYEMFTGKHPFYDHETDTLDMQGVLYAPPNMQDLVESPLHDVIETLLRKQAVDSYATAYEVLIAFYDALGQTPPTESQELRERVLTYGRFVGREDVLNALKAAVESSQGSGWLIGGQSGVGKSRLIDEIRIHTLTLGQPVIIGQASHKQGQSLRVWQEVLQGMSFIDDIAELMSEQDIMTLSTIAPDLPMWLESPLTQENKPHMVTKRVADSLINIFRRMPRRLVLILEDLHWMRDGLEILQALASELPTLPITLVASYRNEETPHLPNLLPQMRSRLLDKLQSENVVELVQAYVGQQTNVTSLAHLVHQEAEGNAFLIVELLRALVAEVGLLGLASLRHIPRSLASEGIKGIIRKRLQRLPSHAQTLLKSAAIMGRELDLNLLQVWLKDLPITPVLLLCAEEGMIEAVNQEWRFAHHIIRETLLNDIPDDERRTLHAQVASIAIAQYADKDEKAYFIAYHCFWAQRWQETLAFATRANQQAQHSDAHFVATESATWALEALKHLDNTPEHRLQRLDMLLRYDESSFRVLPTSARLVVIQEAEQLAKTLTSLETVALQKLAVVYIQFSRAYSASNDIKSATQYAHKSLALAQMLGSNDLLGMCYVVLGITATQQGNPVKAITYLQVVISWNLWETSPRYAALALIYRMACAGFQGQRDELAQHYKRLENNPDVQKSQAVRVQYLTTIGFSLMVLGAYREALDFCTQAMQAIAQTDDILIELILLNTLAIVQWSLGNKVACEETLQQTKLRLETIHNQTFMRDILEAWLLTYWHDKETTTAFEARLDRLEATAIQNENLYAQGLVARWRARLALNDGDQATAESHMETSNALFITINSQPELARNQVLLAELRFVQGNLLEARHLLDQAQQQFEGFGGESEIQSIQALASSWEG